MKSRLFQFIRDAFRREPPLHPIDSKLARFWIKQRLLAVYPHLRNRPEELDRAYRALSLEARPGYEEGDGDTVFVLHAPELG